MLKTKTKSRDCGPQILSTSLKSHSELCTTACLGGFRPGTLTAYDFLLFLRHSALPDHSSCHKLWTHLSSRTCGSVCLMLTIFCSVLGLRSGLSVLPSAWAWPFLRQTSATGGHCREANALAHGLSQKLLSEKRQPARVSHGKLPRVPRALFQYSSPLLTPDGSSCQGRPIHPPLSCILQRHSGQNEGSGRECCVHAA